MSKCLSRGRTSSGRRAFSLLGALLLLSALSLALTATARTQAAGLAHPARVSIWKLVAPATCTSPLVKVGQACADESGFNPAEWKLADGTAEWDHPNQWKTTYVWTMPATVPVTGAPLDLTLGATELTGSANTRICPAMEVKGGDFTVKGTNPIGICAQGGQTNSANPQLDLIPPASSSSTTITVLVGLQDGPTFYYTYQAAAPAAKAKISYLFRGDFAQPKTATKIAMVKLGGLGSFTLAGSLRSGTAPALVPTGSAVIELHSTGGRVHTIELTSTSAFYTRQGKDQSVRVTYKVKQSTIGCMPVGAQTRIFAEESPTSGDRIIFVVCGVRTSSYQAPTEAVIIKTG